MEEVVNKYLYKNKAAEAWNRELPLPEIVQAWNVYSYLKVQRARFSQGWEAGWILKIAYFLENHTGTDDWQWCYIGNMSYRPVEMWWHTRRNQILSSCYTYGGRQFSRLLAAKVCASAVVMLDTPCYEVVWEYWLPTPFASFSFTSPPVRHRVPSHFNWTLQQTEMITPSRNLF